MTAASPMEIDLNEDKRFQTCCVVYTTRKLPLPPRVSTILAFVPVLRKAKLDGIVFNFCDIIQPSEKLFI